MQHAWERKCVQDCNGKLFERKRPQWISKHALQDNIKMHLQEIGVAVVSWINLDHGREKWRSVVTAAVDLRVL